jgi:hypothetical protein
MNTTSWRGMDACDWKVAWSCWWIWVFRRNARSHFSELKRLISAVANLGLCGNKD